MFIDEQMKCSLEVSGKFSLSFSNRHVQDESFPNPLCQWIEENIQYLLGKHRLRSKERIGEEIRSEQRDKKKRCTYPKMTRFFCLDNSDIPNLSLLPSRFFFQCSIGVGDAFTGGGSSHCSQRCSPLGLGWKLSRRAAKVTWTETERDIRTRRSSNGTRSPINRMEKKSMWRIHEDLLFVFTQFSVLENDPTQILVFTQGHASIVRSKSSTDEVVLWKKDREKRIFWGRKRDVFPLRCWCWDADSHNRCWRKKFRYIFIIVRLFTMIGQFLDEEEKDHFTWSMKKLAIREHLSNNPMGFELIVPIWKIVLTQLWIRSISSSILTKIWFASTMNKYFGSRWTVRSISDWDVRWYER